MPTSNTKHGIITGLTAIIIAVAIVGGAYWYMSGDDASRADVDEQSPAVDGAMLPPATSGGLKIGADAYTLTDMNGKSITEKSFPDKYKLVFFGFTHCEDECPLAMHNVAEALNRLGPSAAKVQAIFVSVDPRRDTTSVIKKWLANFDTRILGATGTPAQLKAAVDSFKVYASVTHDETSHHQDDDGDDAEVVNHSDNLFLFKPGNGFVNVFNGDVDAGTLTAALKSAVVPAGK